jgi:hypothetical protein
VSREKKEIEVIGGGGLVQEKRKGMCLWYIASIIAFRGGLDVSVHDAKVSKVIAKGST